MATPTLKIESLNVQRLIIKGKEYVLDNNTLLADEFLGDEYYVITSDMLDENNEYKIYKTDAEEPITKFRIKTEQSFTSIEVEKVGISLFRFKGENTTISDSKSLYIANKVVDIKKTDIFNGYTYVVIDERIYTPYTSVKTIKDITINGRNVAMSLVSIDNDLMTVYYADRIESLRDIVVRAEVEKVLIDVYTTLDTADLDSLDLNVLLANDDIVVVDGEKVYDNDTMAEIMSPKILTITEGSILTVN